MASSHGAFSTETLEETPKIEVAGSPLSENRVTLMSERCKRDAPSLSFKQCVQKYWAPTLILAQQSREQEKTATSNASTFFSTRVNRILYEALVQELSRKPLSAQEKQFVKKVRRAWQEKLKKPLRIRIAHLYVQDGLQAAELQSKLHPDLSAREFKELCRQFSKDESTYQSGGDLGFVAPDGSTEYPEITAPPELYKAALALKDGEFSSKPIKVPGGFSLIQRRGTLQASEPKTEEQKQAIERRIRVSLQTNRQEALIEQLRSSQLKFDPAALKAIKLNLEVASHQPAKAR